MTALTQPLDGHKTIKGIMTLLPGSGSKYPIEVVDFSEVVLGTEERKLEYNGAVGTSKKSRVPFQLSGLTMFREDEDTSAVAFMSPRQEKSECLVC